MRTQSKLLTLIVATVLGTGLAACHRGGDDNKSASSQDSSSPMNQAPKQGYTGPASPSNSTPSSTTGAGADTSSSGTSGTTGGASSSQPGGTMSNTPPSPDQSPQQQQQR